MAKNGEGFDVGGESLAMLHEFSRNFEKFESTMKEDGTLINNKNLFNEISLKNQYASQTPKNQNINKDLLNFNDN